MATGYLVRTGTGIADVAWKASPAVGDKLFTSNQQWTVAQSGGTYNALYRFGGGINDVRYQNITLRRPLGSLSVGSIVKVKLGGTAWDCKVVHQGLPDSMYDSSCNGTWLLLKDIYTTHQWDGTNNDYKNSDIHSYLNGTFLNLFDNNIKNTIKQVKIPYYNGTGSSGSVLSGANGLSCKIFLLSGYELGWDTSYLENLTLDGVKLAYFNYGTGTTANNKRIANHNGNAAGWWTRSPFVSNSSSVCGVYQNGNYISWTYISPVGVRPAFILPDTALVDDSGNIVA